MKDRSARSCILRPKRERKERPHEGVADPHHPIEAGRRLEGADDRFLGLRLHRTHLPRTRSASSSATTSRDPREPHLGPASKGRRTLGVGSIGSRIEVLGSADADGYRVLTEEDLVETALLRYAQKQATEWGADRFAAEFRRRDLEERWLEAARTNTTPYTPDSRARSRPHCPGPSTPPRRTRSSRPATRDEWRLTRPAHARHASVPRPPAVEPQSRSGRASVAGSASGRTKDPAWTISPAEVGEDVARGAPALRPRGSRHTLTVRFSASLERMPGNRSARVALVCGIVGLATPVGQRHPARGVRAAER